MLSALVSIILWLKPGFKLNPDEKRVKGIIKAIERNNGKCPCVHTEPCDDLLCPCSDYRRKDFISQVFYF